MIPFFNKITDVLNKHEIPYMLSGSVAMSLYILPRATRDFDFIIHLQPGDIDRFVENFSEGYYCDADAVKEAVERQGMFNIIDHESGFKADFVVLKNAPFRQMEFSRRIQMDFYGKPIYVVSPEDLLISKLIWIQDLQSAIQMEDIRNIAEKEDLDKEYISSWIKKLNLNTFNLLDV
ncbi:hypothetical protein [Chitinophaga barathri]|uniref:Nucleotidyl transferase AbiEii/AbiGii toxin family protein n=1 Tax=Chitinophaga barathri TaxID=1647451 RepID=A0A3N4MBU6_9BACT|nr:hypothetical protein [Chitinophaga barathri]RPD39286.1 hypothetical protein EG028_19350 [Chitinophaga barathri]